MSLLYVELDGGNGGVVVNISDGGLAIQAAHPLMSQSVADLRMNLPKSHAKIAAQGQITWMGESRKNLGIRFLDLPEASRQQIREWIEADGRPNLPPRQLKPLRLIPLSSPFPAGSNTSSGAPPSPRREELRTPRHQSKISMAIARAMAVPSSPIQVPSPLAPSIPANSTNLPAISAPHPIALEPTPAPPVSLAAAPVAAPFPQLVVAAGLAADPVRLAPTVIVPREHLPATQQEKLPNAEHVASPTLLSATAAPPPAPQLAVPPRPTADSVSPTPTVIVPKAQPSLQHARPPYQQPSANAAPLALSTTAASIPVYAPPTLSPGASMSLAPAVLLSRERAPVEQKVNENAAKTAVWRGLAQIPIPRQFALLALGAAVAMGLILAVRFNGGRGVKAADEFVSQSAQTAKKLAIRSEATAAEWLRRIGRNSPSSQPSAPIVAVTPAAATGTRQQITGSIPPAAGPGRASAVEARPAVQLDADQRPARPVPANKLPAATRPSGGASDSNALAVVNIPEPPPASAELAPASPAAPAIVPVTQSAVPAVPAPPAETVNGSVSVSSRFRALRISSELRSQGLQGSETLQMGKLVSSDPPAYPELALRERVQGTVRLHVIVNSDGSVASAEIASGPPLLSDPSLLAVRSWRYGQSLLGTRPIEQEQDVILVFTLQVQPADQR